MSTSPQVVNLNMRDVRDLPDDPVKVHLLINSSSNGNRFDMIILETGWSGRYTISMTNEDLRQLNQQLRAEMGKAIFHYTIKHKLSQADLKADLSSLARMGNYAFRRVFSDPQAREAMQNLLSFSDQITIEVNSEDFSLPWELLYSEPLEEPLSYEKFWGMKYVISRVIGQESRPPVSPRIRVNPLPKLGLLAFKHLPSVDQYEIPFFERLQEEGKILLDKMPSLDPTQDKRKVELDRFKRFWKKNFHIAHFACHACYIEQPHADSFIQLSNGIRITLFDLELAEITIKQYPLVILNACEMGQLNSLNNRCFVKDFIKYGARGVVATEYAVPDKLAFEFTEELYAYLLDGKRLGESILKTRTRLLERGNPVGLLYSLYAPPATRLEYVK